MKKRIVSVLLVMALLVPTVTACHDSSKDNQATKDVEATGYNPEEAAKKFDFGELSDADKNYTIEMGYFNCDHMVGAIIGEKAGIYKALGLNVNVTKSGETLKALTSGAMDVGYTGIEGAIRAVNQGAPFSMAAANHMGGSINLANNPEMIAFVADYKGNTRDYDKAELTEKELQEEYPLFLQWDKRWGCLAYGDDSNVAISGCGPTTLAMAVVALTGNEEATPAAIAKFAMQEGFYMSGTGTMWSLMTEGAAAYGVRSEQINISQTEIKQHLDQGDIVICSVRQGDFTTGGHFILLYDYDDEGFSINDPFSLYRSGQKWNYGKIRSQIKAVWALKAK